MVISTAYSRRSSTTEHPTPHNKWDCATWSVERPGHPGYTHEAKKKKGQARTSQSTTISQRVNTYVYPCRISIEFKVIYDSQMIYYGQ